MIRKTRLALIVGVAFVAGLQLFETTAPPANAEADAKQPKPAVIELGRRLFMDPTASREGVNSCASCHDPEKAFSDARVLSPDDAGPTARHSQTLLDLTGEGFHWDGEFETVRQLLVARVAPLDMARKQAKDLADKRVLAAQQSRFEMSERAIVPVYYAATPSKPDAPPPTPVAERLAEDGRYARSFRDAFGDDTVTIDRVLDAMDAYCASIRSTTNAFDRFRAGDAEALSPAAKRGLTLFEGRAECAKCHLTTAVGGRAPFTDGQFHDTGVALTDRPWRPDAGRAGVTLLRKDDVKFKTPTLRDVARHAPYMHDGKLATLTDVVKYYANSESSAADPRSEIHRFVVGDGEVADLVEFLHSLTGDQRAALGFRPKTKPLRVRIEDLAGAGIPGLRVAVTPFGDRLGTVDDIDVAERTVTDGSGVALIRRPPSTHLVLTSGQYEIGLSRPIPDSAESLTLVATPKDTVSLRVRRGDRGPTLPQEIKVFAADTPMTQKDGSPTEPRFVLRRMRQLTSREAIYTAKAPAGGEMQRFNLMIDPRTVVQCELDLAGGASETIVIGAAGGK